MDAGTAVAPTRPRLLFAAILFFLFAPVFESSYACLAIGCAPVYHSISSVLFFNAPTDFRISGTLAMFGILGCYALSCAAFLLLARFSGKK